MKHIVGRVTPRQRGWDVCIVRSIRTTTHIPLKIIRDGMVD
jgi:hypothetical protein